MVTVLVFTAIHRLLTLVLYGCLLIMFGSSYTCSSAQAQTITADCETTMIYQPGVGWIEGSEITTCENTVTNVNDGSQLVDSINNSCGTGNPCPDAPPDTDDGLTEEQKCMLEQATEAAIDKLAQQIAGKIMENRDWKNREYGAVIIKNSAGKLHDTELFRGSSLGGSVDFEFSISTSDTIVAAVHNHTRNSYNNATGPSNHDWDVAKTWVGNGWAQANTYSEYILSYRGSFAEFDYDKDFGKNEAKGSDRKDA